MSTPRTMFEKIWARHVVAEGPGGHVLLYVDRHLLHEGTTAAFGRLARSGRTVRRPDLSFATADHYLLTSPGSPTSDAETRGMVDALGRHTAEQRILYFGVGDPRRGIVHIIGPEQGLTVPGITLVCGDSHTATHGAFGALAFGIGSSEVEHVLATQTLWQKKPLTMRISVEGRLAPGVGAKDVILAIIAKIGAGGGVRHAIEYAGSTIRDMSMDERMTVCNMSIEAGARAGMIAPDETTYAYIEGRPLAPSGEAWRRALAEWKALPSDADAKFDREVQLAASDIAPTVTWGTSPQDALPITARVPDPAAVAEPGRRESMTRALAYMGLDPGHAAQRHHGQPRLHRLVHEQPARRPSRRGARGEGAPRGGAGVDRAGLGADQAGGRGRGPRSRLRRRGLRVARGRMLDVRRDERRDGRRPASASRPRRTATSRDARARAPGPT